MLGFEIWKKVNLVEVREECRTLIIEQAHSPVFNYAS